MSRFMGLLASGRSREEILKAYPYLGPADINESLAYAAWRVEEYEVPLAVACVSIGLIRSIRLPRTNR